MPTRPRRNLDPLAPLTAPPNVQSGIVSSAFDRANRQRQQLAEEGEEGASVATLRDTRRLGVQPANANLAVGGPDGNEGNLLSQGAAAAGIDLSGEEASGRKTTSTNVTKGRVVQRTAGQAAPSTTPGEDPKPPLRPQVGPTSSLPPVGQVERRSFATKIEEIRDATGSEDPQKFINALGGFLGGQETPELVRPNKTFPLPPTVAQTLGVDPQQQFSIALVPIFDEAAGEVVTRWVFIDPATGNPVDQNTDPATAGDPFFTQFVFADTQGVEFQNLQESFDNILNLAAQHSFSTDAQERGILADFMQDELRFANDQLLQQSSQEFTAGESELDRNLRIALQDDAQAHDMALNNINNGIQIRLQELQTGFRFGDVEGAIQARQEAQELERARFQLEQQQQFLNFMSLIGQQPQILGLLRQTLPPGFTVGGIDITGLLNGTANVTSQVPNIQEFSRMSPQQQEQTVFNLSATLGLKPETVILMIEGTAPGSTGRLANAT